MADFNKCFEKTMGHEGGFAANPHDSGGETYKGIARNFWPKWGGWRYVDNAKAAMVAMPPYGTREYQNWTKALNATLAANPTVQNYVRDFYKANFWDVCRGDDIVNQDVADWLCDHFINAGGRGVKWMQEAAGVTADGAIGPKSVAAINATDAVKLLQRAKEIAGAYRLAKIRENPSQRQFGVSWLTRDGYTREEAEKMLA